LSPLFLRLFAAYIIEFWNVLYSSKLRKNYVNIHAVSSLMKLIIRIYIMREEYV
jgi:hypothetical protein